MASVAVATAAAPVEPVEPLFVPEPRPGHLLRTGLIVALLTTVVLVGSLLWNDVPSWLDSHIQSQVRQLYGWITANRKDHWLFTNLFSPISDVIDACVRFVLWILRGLRWTGVLVLTAAIGLSTGGYRAAFWGTLAMFGVGVVGYWQLTMITLALMIVSIVLALAIGIPIGIWTARNERVERLLRPLLDTAQVMPVFVYLGVLVLAFGIQYPPAVFATIVYAIPPAVRLTNHGLRGVPVVMNEVGESFGCTTRQQLVKVQLPIARRTILLGLNQVIMMAFGIVVIGSLLGTGDTGNEVLKGLQKNDVGSAAAAGMAIVFAAIALDRITTGERHTTTFIERAIPRALPRFAVLAVAVL